MFDYRALFRKIGRSFSDILESLKLRSLKWRDVLQILRILTGDSDRRFSQKIQKKIAFKTSGTFLFSCRSKYHWSNSVGPITKSKMKLILASHFLCSRLLSKSSSRVLSGRGVSTNKANLKFWSLLNLRHLRWHFGNWEHCSSQNKFKLEGLRTLLGILLTSYSSWNVLSGVTASTPLKDEDFWFGDLPLEDFDPLILLWTILNVEPFFRTLQALLEVLDVSWYSVNFIHPKGLSVPQPIHSEEHSKKSVTEIHFSALSISSGESRWFRFRIETSKLRRLFRAWKLQKVGGVPWQYPTEN